ncbi:M50 family metallopeptidase [Dermabacter vaginalis]|uniref:M50 family metallopeptidase n=1 Tax=Dermabacter vaginalis TaxID=1630135 RepID=UPI001EF701E2|nr:M50 family metallopeptidase [Dermabacter vaginalis]MCG7443812.1 site-2 protease family protein [Dermabacter vaginalis]
MILLYVLGICLMVAGLGLSIALHEIGHLVPAKRFGVRVTQYMIGFGPTLFSRVKGETEYGIKAIPLGGYIRMIGMFPPHKGEDPNVIREDSTGFFQQMSEEAKEWDSSQYSAEDRHRTFVSLSAPKKLVVMLGGPTMNLLISIVLTAIVLSGFGLPNVTSEVDAVSRCVVPATAPKDASCEGMPEAPAYAAGIRPGDVITSVDGTEVANFHAMSTLIREHPNESIEIGLVRDGREMVVKATPVANEVVARDAEGAPVKKADGTYATVEAGFLGVTGTQELTPRPLTEVPGAVWEQFTGTAKVVVTLPVRVWDIGKAVFSSEERDQNGPMGVVGVSRLAGEIVSHDSPSFSLKEKAWTFLSMLGSLNMALFVFNLVPLMPLDGGHVASALYEAARRRLAKLRGKPDPGPVDASRMLPVTNVIALAFILMSVLLIYADIVKPVTLFR